MNGGAETANRRWLLWGLLVLGAIGATVGTLIALSSSVYSASAFVERYFSAIAGDNIAEVLRTPGVLAESDHSTALLRSGLISQAPSDVSVSEDAAASDGSHTVTVSYQLSGQSHSAQYRIAPEPALLGLLPRWRFVDSPLAELTVTVTNGTHFNVAGLTLDARAAALGDPAASNPVASYLAVAPAVYTLHFDSELAAADPTTATVLPGTANSATVAVLPTQLLVDRVQSKLDDFLAECVKQTVLQPSGCPFGATVDDRVLADPSWSIVQNPVVTLEPGDGGFVMPSTPGIVHLSVAVQSLFDGAKSTLEKDVEYQVGLVVKLRDDGSIAIQLN